MSRCRQLAVLLLAGSALPPALAVEGYSIWDNFDGATQVSATRWLSFERTRLIEGGVMHLVQRDLGSQTDDSGSFNNNWGANLANPGPVTQLRAVVTVNAYDVTGCGANDSPSTVQARLVGGYFNAGPGPAVSRINDVGATVRLRRDSNSADAPGVLRVEGTVFQCTTTDCNNTIELGSVDLGTAALGEAVTLRLEWEQAKHRFNFFRGSNPVMHVPYAASDAQAPYFRFRAIGTRTGMANCFSGSRTEGFIDAKFDKVSVNASAAPP